MPDQRCQAFLEYIPFVGAVMGNSEGTTPVVTRLLETAVMSAVAGGFAMYISVEVIKAELDYLRKDVTRVEQTIEKVNTKVEDMKSDLYRPNRSGRD